MKLASIETISEITPHGNAERLELARVLGWQAVVKKGEFKTGERAVFVVIDTILPNAVWSEFLADKNSPDKPIRLKTAKLRGEYSQGLVRPRSVLPEHMRSWQTGADVGGELGVKKYEKEIPTQLAGEAIGGFPTFIVAQTDEENALSNPELVAEVLAQSRIHGMSVTLKLDGSSCTVIAHDGEITHVCSRRYSLKESTENGFWLAARKLSIPKGWSGAIQGELMGPGVQGNQLKLREPELFVFQIKHDGRFLAPREMGAFSEKLGAKNPPALATFPKEMIPAVEVLQQTADALKLAGGEPAEGLVARPASHGACGNGRPLGFKIINRNYKD